MAEVLPTPAERFQPISGKPDDRVAAMGERPGDLLGRLIPARPVVDDHQDRAMDDQLSVARYDAEDLDDAIELAFA